MKTVIYNMYTQQVIKIIDDTPNFFELKDNEDFMPVKLWNEGCEASGESDRIIKI